MLRHGILFILLINLVFSMAFDQTVECAGNSPPKQDSIGSATMMNDGTVVLRLRAEGPGGTVGDALFSYPPKHPRYKAIRKHIGGIKVGESKPVPPWPEQRERSPAAGSTRNPD